MKPLIIVMGHGYIPSFTFCDCGSETYANMYYDGTIICGGCDKVYNVIDFEIRWETSDRDRQFEGSING